MRSLQFPMTVEECDMDNVFAGCRVLVADNQILIAWAAAENLEAEGAHVVGPAYSLQVALALLISERVEAAVLDIRLGEDLVYTLADALAATGVPFIFATGYGVESLPEMTLPRAYLL